MAAVQSIVARTYGDMVRMERDLAEDVYPGQLLELTSNDEFQLHSQAGGPAIPVICDMDFAQGKEVTDQVTTADSGKAFGFVPRRGEEARVLLDHDENISIGDFLMSNGDGYFSKRATDQESSAGIEAGIPLAIAREAVNVTDSSGAESLEDYFILVQFL